MGFKYRIAKLYGTRLKVVKFMGRVKLKVKKMLNLSNICIYIIPIYIYIKTLKTCAGWTTCKYDNFEMTIFTINLRFPSWFVI